MSVQAFASPPGLPAGFLVAPLTGQTRVNGVALQIMTVSSILSPEQACSTVAASWRAAAHAAVGICRRVGPWLLINRRAGGCEQVVQLRAVASTATGYYSESDLNARLARVPGPRLPIPAGARLVNVVQSSISGAEARQFTFHYALGPNELARRLWHGAIARGWATIADPAAPGMLLDFERAHVQVRAVLVSDAGGSSLVLVEFGTGPLT